MKLFLKEHRSLVIVQVIQFSVILLLLWLDRSANISIVLYSLFLSFFIFLCYLIYRYMSHRKFYKRLSKPLSTLEESLQHLEHTPLSTALNNLLKTQYQQYEHQILHAKRKQEEHLIFIDRWVHQMKTPLSVLQLMAQDLDEPESSNFREELDRMQTGLQMVLHMARLRTIEQDFHIKKVELQPFVHEVIKEKKRSFIRNGIFPKINVLKNNIIESDEKWLFFMCNQLIDNAVKYSKNKAKQINITIGERGGKSFIEIDDFGVGIPKEDVKRVFDLFYTGENGRKFRESTGVGLYLVKEVAHYLGHQLQVESEVGVGSTFRIIF